MLDHRRGPPRGRRCVGRSVNLGDASAIELRVGGLAGKVVLVTGGSSGIGRATCLAFGRQGCRVAVHFHAGRSRADKVVRAVAKAGGQAAALGADLRSAGEARALVQAVERCFGGLDVLVNNAGDPGRRAAFLDVDETLWQDSLALNLSAPFWVTQAAVPLLARGPGVVLFVSTGLTRRPGTGQTVHYTAAKGGLEALTVALAAELSPTGIRVNGLAPGVVDTALQARISTPEQIERAASRTLVGRIGTPEEIAAMLVVLASPAGAYINGQVIVADGGRN